MFRENTVFIIGAGASAHYDYPTGEGLVKKMRDFATLLSNLVPGLRKIANFPDCLHPIIATDGTEGGQSTNSYDAWNVFARQCDRLAKKLATIDPLVIDYFLAWNKDIQSIAKLILAMVILEAEASYVSGSRKPALPRTATGLPEPSPPYSESGDNWYRFILYSLASRSSASEDLLQNKVKFVTFNYDTSLDHFLWRGLSETTMYTESDIDRFLDGDRIVHVYGKIRDERDPDFNHARFHSLEKMRLEANQFPPRGMPADGSQPSIFAFLNQARQSSENIRPIAQQEKDHNGSRYDAIRKSIEDASVVIILGYGFDENNNACLGLTKSLTMQNSKRVYFTNFNDNNLINKRAGKLMFSNNRQFLPPASPIQDVGSFCAEKSTRKVYGALAEDFDCLEL